MCSELNPKVQFFDRHKVVSVIGEQASRVRATLKSEMIEKHFALTCDHWTSRAGTNYLGVTCHYISDTWQMRSFTLGCEEHAGGSKAGDIIRELTNAWTAFDLDVRNMVCVVTDTAPVMGAFGKQLPNGVPHHYCVNHVMELTTVSVFLYFYRLCMKVNA